MNTGARLTAKVSNSQILLPRVNEYLTRLFILLAKNESPEQHTLVQQPQPKSYTNTAH